MTGSGTTYTASIPAGTNTAGANVSYYVFTSGPNNVATNGSNADFYTINLNNNAGANYTYTVLSPATIYQHNFGTTTITAHPYTVAPGVFATNLSNSSWANSNSAWTSSVGSAGEAITLSNSSGTPTITLTFDVASGFAVNVTSFNFWRGRSATGAQNWSLAINGTAVGSGTVPETGAAIGNTSVSNAVNGLTGTVTVVLSLSGASSTGTFRLDDFTLNGIVYPLPGPTAAVQSPVGTTIANGGSRASFGSIVVGTTADFPVRIRNLGGTNTLTVNSINFGGANAGDLTLVTPPTFPFNVAPGAFQDITVRVAPGAVGARAATMTVASNDVSGNASYVINLSATGISSTASDVIDNTTYSSASPDFNINTQYINFVNSTQNSNDKPVVMKFRIRDGGAGAPDADNLPTSLTAISFTVRNTSGVDRSNFIQTAVLTTEAGTVLNLTPPTITGGEIQFTGLSAAAFTVPDNGASASNLHLRVSFVAANVIDNEKLVYQVSSATAATSGSQFFNASAGAARTDNLTSNDQNRIEVIATRFAFVQQPTNTGFGQTMTPSPSVEAQDANSRRDLDFTTAISLTSTGTMTGSPISVNASAGLASFTSVVHTVQQTGRQLTAGNGSLTAGLSSLFDINASSGTTDFFRTATGFTTGNWNATGCWESSPDNATWVAATVVPNSSASGITVRSGTLTITADASARLLTVQTGAILVHNNGAVFTIAADGTAATDFLVQGRYDLNGTQPVLNPGVTVIIASNAEVRAVNNTSGESDNFARQAAVTWQNNSLFNWAATLGFEASGETYFPGTPANVIPIFRLSSNPASLGGAGTTTINGVFDCIGNITFQSATAIVFRNGITGTGTMTQNNTCGQFRITGTTSQLGSGSGTLTLSLRNDVASGLALQSGTCILQGNVTSNTGPLYVDAGATLNAGTNSISGTSSFTLNSGATLISANAAGVDGSIAITGTPSFNSGSNYVFNGTVNQVTGTRMANPVGTLTINNSGAASSNFVTLSNNNTQATTFNLQAGVFRAGSGNTVRIAAGGTVNGTGGNVSINSNGEGGTIEFLANGAVTGTPTLWNVTIANSGGGVNFANNATIHNLFTINANGFVNPNAPRYATGSTLVYNSGGAYNRSIEFGNTAGNPGYPHHVLVQGGTTLNMGSATPTALETGGNFSLGTSTTAGNANMGALTLPLVVRGNLTIGASGGPVSALTLSTAVLGDLHLHGNFTRHLNSLYNDQGRAIFFRGSGNSTISTPSAPPASVSDPTLQDYAFAIVDKDVATARVILQTPTGIGGRLTLTRGIVETLGFPMYIKNPAPDATNDGIVGGSADSYIDGPLFRYTSVSAMGNYWFPIGKSAGGGYRPLRFTNTNTGGNRFVAQYFSGTTATPSAGQDVFQSELTGIQANEYWQFDQVGTEATTGRVALMYRLAGATWRDAAGDPLTPVGGEYNVAIVKRTEDVGPGSWNYTKPPFTFNTATPDFEARLYSDDGLIVTGDMYSFSPFTFGFSFTPVLGVLPVKLLSFEGALQGADARLQWRIDSDKDLRHFELQYSTDGSQFSTIATVAPAGRQYQYLHRGLAAGKHYYRLLVKEKNGQHFFSKTVLLSRSASATYVVGLQQNPVSTSLALNLWSASAQAAEYSLTDMGGRQLIRQRSQLLPGANQLRMPVAQLPAGVYHLTVLTADGVQETLRVLKQ